MMNTGNNALSTRALQYTPLPVKQLLIIASLLLVEPLTNSIVRSATSNVPPEFPGQGFALDNPSLQSQLLESTLFLAKAATVYHWGRLSDKLGRRPILLLGSLGLGISTFALGLLNNTWVQMTAKSMQGVFAGNIEVAKSVIAEITDSSSKQRAYAALPMMQSMGVSIGSAMGSFLVDLDERFPFLQHISFITNRPFLIPCLIAGSYALFSFHLTYTGFIETLPSKFQINWQTIWNIKDEVTTAAISPISKFTVTSTLLQNGRVQPCYGTVNNLNQTMEGVASDLHLQVQQEITKILPVDNYREYLRLTELIGPKLLIALLNYAFLSFLDQVQQTLLPLVYTSPDEKYGLGLSSDDMVQIMTRWGTCNAFAQLVIFPWVLQHFGKKKVYVACLKAMLVFFGLFPVIYWLMMILDGVGVIVWGLISLQMGLSSFVFVAYGCTQMFIMDAVPDKSSLGAINGIGQSVGSSFRMIASPFVHLTFALSMPGKWFDGHIIHGLLLATTLTGVMLSTLLPEESVTSLRQRDIE